MLFTFIREQEVVILSVEWHRADVFVHREITKMKDGRNSARANNEKLTKELTKQKYKVSKATVQVRVQSSSLLDVLVDFRPFLHLFIPFLPSFTLSFLAFCLPGLILFDSFQISEVQDHLSQTEADLTKTERENDVSPEYLMTLLKY